MAWTLVPCLVALRNEFNLLAPGRDKASDGSIGDAAHRNRSSDHNPDETGVTPYEDGDDRDEVHAIDIDEGLRGAPYDMEEAVRRIVTRHRTGQDDRLQNVIYRRRVWSRSWDWEQRPYTGSNPHDEHAHFSARYTTAQENDTRPWGLIDEDEEEDDMSAEVVREGVAMFFREARHAYLKTPHYQGLVQSSDKPGVLTKERYDHSLVVLEGFLSLLDKDVIPNQWGDAATNPNNTIKNAMKDAQGARVEVRALAERLTALETMVSEIRSTQDRILSLLQA